MAMVLSFSLIWAMVLAPENEKHPQGALQDDERCVIEKEVTLTIKKIQYDQSYPCVFFSTKKQNQNVFDLAKDVIYLGWSGCRGGNFKLCKDFEAKSSLCCLGIKTSYTNIFCAKIIGITRIFVLICSLEDQSADLDLGHLRRV